jgi:DNA mismatch endonuclease (patch repair protein)
MASRRKAGHRRWAPRGGKVPGRHRGDIMSQETRSVLMSRIRGTNTSPERVIAEGLAKLGYAPDRHPTDLPGRPDFVFRKLRLAVFVDGDFWHGYRFPLWKHKLAPWWREKIQKNRERDRANFARLRRRGWRLIRIWEHQVECKPERCFERIVAAIKLATADRSQISAARARLRA